MLRRHVIPRRDAFPATGVTPDVVSWTWGYVRQFCFPQHQQQQQQPYSRAGLAAARSFGMSGDYFVLTVIIPVM